MKSLVFGAMEALESQAIGCARDGEAKPFKESAKKVFVVEPMKLSIAFSGTQRGMTAPQKESVKRILDANRFDISYVMHGGCRGADRDFHAMTVGYETFIYPSTEEQLTWAMGVMPMDSTRHISVSSLYLGRPLVRNRLMVDMGDLFIATPGGSDRNLAKRNVDVDSVRTGQGGGSCGPTASVHSPRVLRQRRTKMHNDKCRVRKHTSEESAKRVRWAMGLRGIDTSKLDARYCRVCHAWHLVQNSSTRVVS